MYVCRARTWRAVELAWKGLVVGHRGLQAGTKRPMEAPQASNMSPAPRTAHPLLLHPNTHHNPHKTHYAITHCMCLLIPGGHDITKGMRNIYSIMGLCPQHDLLWGTLSGREHLLFYGTLKGMAGAAAAGAAWPQAYNTPPSACFCFCTTKGWFQHQLPRQQYRSCINGCQPPSSQVHAYIPAT